ncbi:MAG: hypothetical protein GC155_06060 [Alphaproteobacteria bacterium]|nr:hypothetical protein [Alphaproteobacteria bacterium]
MPPVRPHKPNQRHIDCMARLKAALDPALDAQEMLALVSQLVGNLIALQDQRKMTPDMAMQLVARNIEIGNAVAIDAVKSAGGAPN